MRLSTLMIGVAIAAVIGGGANAKSISALGNDGTVYNVDVASGVATIVASVPDPSSSQTEFSPNALGVDGTTITNMTFNGPGSTEDIFVDGVFQQSVGTVNDAVAAGDSENGQFYYVDRNFEVSSVAGNGTGGVSLLGDLGNATTLGDLAVSGTTGYLSYGTSFGVFDLTNVSGGFTSTFGEQRYVGLGFADGDLYGILRDGGDINTSTFSLWQWNGVTGAGGDFIDLGTTISGINDGTELTDASSAVVPLPAAAWMLLAGIGALVAVSRRRKIA